MSVRKTKPKECSKCACPPRKHHACAPSKTLPGIESYCECGAEDCEHFCPGIVSKKPKLSRRTGTSSKPDAAASVYEVWAVEIRCTNGWEPCEVRLTRRRAQQLLNECTSRFKPVKFRLARYVRARSGAAAGKRGRK